MGFPANRQARVEITTTDGRIFDSGVVDPLWGVSADRPADRDLVEKFQAVIEPVLGATCGRELQDLIWNLEREPKAARLMDLATAKGL